jgi:hypothetical protein
MAKPTTTRADEKQNPIVTFIIPTSERPNHDSQSDFYETLVQILPFPTKPNIPTNHAHSKQINTCIGSPPSNPEDQKANDASIFTVLIFTACFYPRKTLIYVVKTCFGCPGRESLD